MRCLREDTQVKVKIGPVVDPTDGVTPVTTLSLSTADEAELFKHDAAAVTDISGATFAAITGADGWYNLTLTTSHTDTAGQLDVVINDDDVCLPVFAHFMVMPTQVWDSLFSTDKLQVDAVEISSDATAAANLEESATGIVVCNTTSGTNTTTTTDSSGIAGYSTDDFYNGRTIVFVSGTLLGQAARITDFNGSTHTFTHTALANSASASSGDDFVVV